MTDAPATDEPTVITSGETTEEDSVTLISAGRSRFVLDGRRYNLRQPRLSEFKKLRKMILDLDSNADEIEQMESMEKWNREAFGILSDKPLSSTSDDWPAWMVGGNLQARLVNHWRALPISEKG